MDLVVLDVETTGTDVDEDYICQFAAVKYVNNKQVDELVFLCKPPVPIPTEASEVHGIYDEDLVKEKPFKDYAQDVVEFCKGCMIGSFNGKNFDMPLLDRELSESGHENIFDESIIYDAYPLYVEHNPRNLENAYRYYGCGEDLSGAHDALVDVLATGDIIIKQTEKEGEDIHAVAEKTCPLPDKRVGFAGKILFDEDNDPYITFGKYKDTKLKDMDVGYLSWMLKQDFDKATKQYIRNFLNENTSRC